MYRGLVTRLRNTSLAMLSKGLRASTRRSLSVTSISKPLGFTLEPVKENDRPIYLDVQVRLESVIYASIPSKKFASLVGDGTCRPKSAGRNDTFHDQSIR